jgi:hypothetical protein
MTDVKEEAVVLVEKEDVIVKEEAIVIEDCMICGLSLSQGISECLPCSHSYHYECLMKTYQMTMRTSYSHKNRCPYCRKSSGYLSLVNGLTKPCKGIHYGLGEDPPEYLSIRCQHTLTRGPRKGECCLKKCQLGYQRCKTHNTSNTFKG